MQNMYKTNPKRRKLLKTTTFTVALFVAAIMVTSAIPTIATPGETTKMKTNLNDYNPAGLAPINTNIPNLAEANINSNPAPLGETMWGYNAYCPSIAEGPVYYDIEDPGTVTLLAGTTSGDFLAGGTWMAEEMWICCEYNSGVLWEVDPDDGTMTSIGGGGQAMNALSWDPLNNRMYGIGNTCDLFEVDYETGATELIGSGGISDTIIAMAFDEDANCYAWDVKFSGNTNLYSVDIETGALTTIGSMGKTLCYAQDGDVCFADGVLYLSAYIYSPEYGGYLCTVDMDTAELTIVGEFQGSAEIDASMFQNVYIPPEHDVGIKEIVKPEGSGYAVPEVPMQVLVKNYGANPEVTDVQMEVIKCEAGPLILEEYFDGSTFPPDGWQTDYWKQSFTNVAGGESPEARCYKYDYPSGQYYDNYIQSPPIDCTGIEKINLKFRWAADVYYDDYCAIYLKYQKNQTAPWKDVTPWDLPLEGDMEGDYWEIGCYGFGENLGTNFSFKFEYIGYYYYFNYWWLDDVTLEACGGCADYAEIVEDVSLAAGEEMLVDFPGYVPPEWQNESYEDTWEEYPIHAFTLLEDQKPKNDNKWKLIDLYYPYLHDVEVSSIDSPAERTIPGQTLPVSATIKNVGQYPECCIPIDIKIGQGVILGTLITEDMSGGVPPAGWTDEHKGYVSYYGWSTSYTSYSGGSSPEARLPYYYALADYVMYTPVIDTSTYPGLKIKFKSYVNHYSGQGLYALEAGYSTDLVNWYASWHEEPGSSGQYEVEVDAVGGSATTYVGWWMKGDPWYINYWYIDDVEIEAVALVEEFTDNMCQGPDIEPGESVTFDFDDWTPEALGEGITTTNDYLIEATIEMEGDKDPGNDLASGQFTLEFWHDTAIEVESPTLGAEPETWLHFDDGVGVNALGLTAGGTFEYAIRLTPDELADYDGSVISTVKRFHGYTSDFQMSGKAKIYAQGTSTSPGDLLAEKDFDVYDNDWHDIVLDEPVEINGGEDLWVSIEVTHSQGTYPAAMDSNNDYPTKGDWITLGSGWNEVSIYGFYCDWLIWAGVESGHGPGGIKVYIQPGTQDIEGLATNFGTFPELDLTCWAEIYEYITDPENATLLYEDNITNIDLDVPLGGTEALIFDDFNFADEGVYGLFLNMPNADDDKTSNNLAKWGIGVDDTDPESSHTLEPATPDGDNGWYVSDVEVTLTASDPEILGVSSGVKEMKYKIGSGSTQTITGSSGSFVVDVDAENLAIEYWAIDNVGNEETHNSFTIDMDQTDPIIDMVYEVEEGLNGPDKAPWEMIFNATCSDATSGMNRVRFLLNGVEQEVVVGPGPVYTWSFLYSGGLDVTITAEAYDTAGNMAIDEIVNPQNININTNSQNLVQKTIEIHGI
jgi:hypothetical protein